MRDAPRVRRARPTGAAGAAAVPVLVAWTALAAACAPGGPDAGDGEARREARAAVERVLEEDRRAHIELDAALLASHLADTLVSVDAGTVTRTSRADVEARFRRYFDGTEYRAWEDVEPPLIRLSPGLDMAWVVRRVRVDRSEPDGAGGRTDRRFVSAWTATYERGPDGWRMTSVTSTFEPASGGG